MQLLRQIVWLYLILLLVRVVLSWFPITPGTPMARVFSFVYSLTEPVLRPVRRLLPPIGIGGMGFDLSPIIVFIIGQLLLQTL